MQEGLASSQAVVLVVSRAAVGKPWWEEEFAAAMAGAVAGVQRLIPVLLDDVPLPPFVASRVWVDFRHLDAPAQYEERFAELVRAVQGVAPGDRPQRGGGIMVPPVEYRPEGPRAARLRIDRQQVVFSCADREWAHPPLGVDGGLRTLVWEVARARSRAGNLVVREPGAAAGGVLHGRLTELDQALGSRFLAGDAGVALAREVARSSAGPLRWRCRWTILRMVVHLPAAQVAGWLRRPGDRRCLAALSGYRDHSGTTADRAVHAQALHPEPGSTVRIVTEGVS
ncbi:MAG: toll/interleukin-1 receptor domain-containing protein [Actinomycetota bacterium]|nr:toll/interleukin-1 receptor domain-containing protein [Actinomycetota bacterium]